MQFYTCFDWFKKLRLFVNERNLKIDVVLKASSAVVIRWFSLNEAPLELFKFISDYLPYFGKINIFFNIIRGLHSMYNLIEVISSWTEQKLRSCDQFLITIMDIRGQFCSGINFIKYTENLSFNNTCII
jgi:hypothetical protein